MEVRAIVLAAGKGTRMQTELPKCALKVIDKPMAEYVADSLKKAGVEDIVTVVGYKRDVLEAILSGWKGSKSSIFSPTPMNLIGLPTTLLRERAAPPRVSESNFVRITPVIPTFSSNSLAMSTAL